MTIRVLLADDHAVMRGGLRALLAMKGDIEVVGEASNGREALKLARETAPDVVLMDIAMPELNGVEATRLIRERCPATRIIVLSMHSTSEHVHRALAAGASGYLLKESAWQEVVAAVHSVSEGGQYFCKSTAAMLDAAPGSDKRARSPLESLSDRERQVLQLVVEGYSSARIAGIVNISPKSVETYRSRLMKKLGVADVPSLVKFALEHGLTPPA
jgi:DNA-binding NarL/FixJ family response regulator